MSARLFDQVSVGDAVAVFTCGDIRRAKVDRITSTRVFVLGTPYNRDTGSQHGGDLWRRSHIKPWTQEHAKQAATIAAEKRAEHAKWLLSRYGWQRISDDQAISAISALRAIGIDVDPETAP